MYSGAPAGYAARRGRHLESASPVEDNWGLHQAAERPGNLRSIRGTSNRSLAATTEYEDNGETAADASDSPQRFQSGGATAVASPPPSVENTAASQSHHHHHHRRHHSAVLQQQLHHGSRHDGGGADVGHEDVNGDGVANISSGNSSSNNLPEDLSMSGKEEVEGAELVSSSRRRRRRPARPAGEGCKREGGEGSERHGLGPPQPPVEQSGSTGLWPKAKVASCQRSGTRTNRCLEPKWLRVIIV